MLAHPLCDVIVSIQLLTIHRCIYCGGVYYVIIGQLYYVIPTYIYDWLVS